MSLPISTPVIPSQPNLPYYGVVDLAIFKIYTRDSYRAEFGVEAPSFNPSRVIKSWFDSTADVSQPDNVSVYNTAARGRDAQWGVHQILIPSAEAAAVNLPGLIKYSAYVVPPTMATRGDSAINPNYLSLEQDARDLSTAVGGTGIQEEQLQLYPVNYPADEKRRIWNILFKGHPVYAGLLLLNKYAQGFGAPGHWDLSKAEPLWVSDPPPPDGLFDTRPPRPLPIRPLLANERFHVGLMDVGIERTDLQQSQAEASGQFTPEDRTMIRAIYGAVVGRGSPLT